MNEFELQQLKEKVDSLDAFVGQLREAGLDRLAEFGYLQFEGVPMRWDTQGMQVATGGSTAVAIYFLNQLLGNITNATEVGFIQGAVSSGQASVFLSATSDGGATSATVEVGSTTSQTWVDFPATQFRLSAILTPSQITGNQDNYSPTGLGRASILRLDTDASRDITGIIPGSDADGRVLLLLNIGANNIVLKDNATSTEANRFQLNGDHTIGPDEGALVWYDNFSTRWRLGAAYAPGSITTAVAAHTADTSDAHDASAISVLDTAGNFTGTDVEAVLAEIADQLGGGGMSLIVKEADQTINTDATLNDDAELLFAVGANEVYQFEGVLIIEAANATMDFRMSFTGPAGAVGSFFVIGADTASGNADSGGDALGATVTVISTAPVKGVRFWGGIHNGGTAGNLTLQWAQSTSDGGNLTVRAGSYMKWQLES